MDVLRLNILLLNEDPKLLSKMKNRLEEQGFRTSCAYSLTEAIELLGHNQFNVVVTDATMPDNDGIKLFKRIGSHIPVVMVSGNFETVNKGEMEKAICCFLDKADIHERLSKAVWTAFKRFKMDQQLQRDSELAA